MPDKLDRVVYVIVASPDAGPSAGIPRPVGITAEHRQANRTCKAIDLGPTGYHGAHVVPLSYLTLPSIPGMREGYSLVQDELEEKRKNKLAQLRGKGSGGLYASR